MMELPFKLRRARLQLMLKHPYLASAVARFPLILRNREEGIGTMATDGYHIYANPGFIEKINSDELLGVLAHELMHNLLGHLEREQEPEPGRWNVAIDHATNLLLEEMNFSLPDPKCCERRFHGLTAEQIYQRLSTRDESDNWDLHLEIGKAGETPCGTEDRQIENHQDSGEGDGEEKQTLHGNGEDAEADTPTRLELKRIREGLQREMLREIQELSQTGKLPGNLPGLLKKELEMAGAAQIPWQDLLSRFMGGLRRSNFRSFPFNRRHIWRGICLPSVGTPGPEHLVAAVDTSGSMSEPLLSQILSELDRIKSVAECGMSLIECDYDIGRVQEVDPWETSSLDFNRWQFTGRGGTSLKPPFRWLDQKIENEGLIPDAMIYMTDGYGDFPEECPVPTLWVVPESGLHSEGFPFGEVLHFPGF